MNRYFVGLDLGQAQDYSALVVLERPVVPVGTPRHLRRPAYDLRYLHRWPLGTAYPAIVKDVRTLLQQPPLPNSILMVDQTGVGRAVVDMLAEGLRGQVTCMFMPVTITAGQQATVSDTGCFNVPKKILVGTLQVLLQSRRLRIGRSLPGAAALVKELENFRIKITNARQESFEAWRASQHDDLVLAVALAAWEGEITLPPLDDPPPEDYSRLVLVT